MGGLMDYRARFYSPSLGRFLQPDTIIPDQTNPQAWNRYAYTINNPLRYSDPTGHRICEDMDCKNDGDDEWDSGGNNGGDDDEGSEDEPEHNSCTYHLCSDSGTNYYLLGWQNFSQAWSIWSNPNATYWQRYGAGVYMSYWGGAHAMAVVGLAGLACAAAGACLAAVEGWLGIGAGAGTTANAACGGDMCASELEYIRYMSTDELRIIKQTGLLRGGDSGVTYFTTDVFETVGGATSRLALKTPPSVGVQFEIINHPEIIGPESVNSLYGRMGLGVQYWTMDPVKVNILNTWDLFP